MADVRQSKFEKALVSSASTEENAKRESLSIISLVRESLTVDQY